MNEMIWQRDVRQDNHSTNRTLLASLGFGDSDKGNPVHELACQFLAQPDVAGHLAALLGGPGGPFMSWEDVKCSCSLNSHRWVHQVRPIEWQFRRANLEFVIGKGEGKYRTTVGFLDVLISYKRRAEIRAEWPCGRGVPTQYAFNPETRQLTGDVFEGEAEIAVEVKAGMVPISDVIRQIKLYRDYVSPRAWALATPYPMDERDIATLANERIHHLHLAAGFQAFVEAAKNAPKGMGQSAVVL